MRWRKLSSAHSIKSIPESGVYQIRWSPDGRPKHIERLNGIDRNGVLYIGQSSRLPSRIIGHYRGRGTFSETFVAYEFGRRISKDDLQVRWTEVGTEKLLNEEERLLTKYIKRYLDSPPMNMGIRRPKARLYS